MTMTGEDEILRYAQDDKRDAQDDKRDAQDDKRRWKLWLMYMRDDVSTLRG